MHALAPEEHVLDDVEVVGQGQVLVHGLDPEPGGVAGAMDLNRLALPEELAVVGRVDPGDAFGQHGLPRSVIPDQRGHLPGRQVEVDLGEGLHRAEVLVDPPHLEQGLGGHARVRAYLPHASTLRVDDWRWKGAAAQCGGAFAI